jgi:hypothetical protein
MGEVQQRPDIPGFSGAHIIAYAMNPQTGVKVRLKNKENLNVNEAGSSIDLPEEGSLQIKSLKQGTTTNWSATFRLSDLARLQKWVAISNSAGNYFNLSKSFPIDCIQVYCDPESDETQLRAGTAPIVTGQYIRNMTADNLGNSNAPGQATTITLSGKADEERYISGEPKIVVGASVATAVGGATSQFSTALDSDVALSIRYKSSSGKFIDITDREATDGTTEDPSYQFKAFDADDAIGAKGCYVLYGIAEGTDMITVSGVQTTS